MTSQSIPEIRSLEKLDSVSIYALLALVVMSFLGSLYTYYEGA